MQNVEDVYTLSPIQEGMLSHTIRAPHSGVFVEQVAFTLAGDLDADAFRAAWSDTITRHPVLRTAFLWDGLDEPLQVVRQEVEAPWHLEDWRGLDSETRDARWRRLLDEDRRDGLELTRAPVMRLTLVRTDDRTHRLLWTFHHLLTDGWSTPLVLRDVFEAYAARLGAASTPRTRPRPYRDYIAWLRDQDPDRAAAFWARRVGDVDAPTPVELAHLGTPRRAGADRHRRTLSEDLTARLRDLARQHRVTLNTVVQGAWALLLHRYSGSDDVVYGSTVAGRPADLAGVEDMVGLFISTLPVRTRYASDQPLGDWLRTVQTALAEMQPFAYTPLVDIQRRSAVPADQPLFESIVVFENYPESPADLLADLDLDVRDLRFVEQSNYPLAVLALPREALEVLFVYDTARFSDEAIERLSLHLATLLAGFVDRPNAAVGTLPLLPPDERRVLLDGWAGNDAPFAHDRTVVDLIDEQAAGQPDAPAVFFQDETLSYGALVERSDRLARAIRAQGVEADVPVGVALDRSTDLIVALLAVLKAGGAYVPLDPAYPADRLRLTLDDARAPIVLTRRTLADRLPETGAALVFVDDPAGPPAEADLPKPAPDDLAYVIYTSGSTGRPKGVAVTHRNLMHSTAARFSTYGDPVGRFLLMSSYAFDSSVAGLFWTLTTGGALVLPPERQEQDLDGLADLIAARAVTHTLMLPSLYGLLLAHAPADRLTSLRTVIVAGEACPPDLVARHHRLRPGAALYNEYGPTEATVWCTVHRTTPEDAAGPVPIGRPIDRTRVYLLDDEARLVPVGLPGELVVAGCGLARGYLGRPDATAAQFPTDVASLPEDRLYRTGDRARRRSDGLLEFLGRVDEQVKIRGYRIEPAEIATVLGRHPAVKEAVVIVDDPSTSERRGPGSARLVAYVAGDASADPADLRTYLQARLPDPMVPAAAVVLDTLPRLPNGKIDRRALPAPDAAPTAASDAFAAPRTPVERQLAQIWESVLGIDEIGLHDHFFEIGGDSILSIQVVSRARQAGLALAPNDLFEAPTLGELSARAAQAETRNDRDDETETGPVPLSPIQHWFFETFHTAPAHWNQAVLIETDPNADPDRLEQALRAVVARHAALRLAFSRDDEGLHARITPPPDALPLRRVDLAGRTDRERTETIEQISADVQAGFDLSEPPLLRAVWFDADPDTPNHVLLVAHHLVIDAVSWTIVLDDLARAYTRLGRGLAPDLAPPPTSYRAWVEGLADDPRFAPDGSPRTTTALLPTDFVPETPATERDAGRLDVTLDPEATHTLLTDANTAYNTRPDELLLAALSRVLAAWSGKPAFGIVLEGHGRDGPADLSRTVGWLTAQYPAELRPPAEDDPGTTIKAIKEQLRDGLDRGAGYGVRRYLHGDPAVQDSAYPTLLFNYLGRRNTVLHTEPFRRLRPMNRSARHALSERPYPLELNASVADGRLGIRWTYDARAYRAETVERLATAHLDALRTLLAHTADPNAGAYTPSDFPEAGLSQDELDQFLGSLG